MQILPNPAKDFVDIKYTLEYNKPMPFQLFDTAGKQIITVHISNTQIGENHYILNSSTINMISGSYLLVLNSNKNFTSQKIILTK